MSGVIQGNARLQNHGVTTAGTTFTVPPSENFTDRSWSATDLVLGEIGLNLTDDRAFFRSLNGIVELQTSSLTSALWVRDGEDIKAVENGLTSPLIYPNILPPDDDVSDLGSSSLRWRDLYLGSKIDIATDLSIELGPEVIGYFGRHFDIGYRAGSAGSNSVVIGGASAAPNIASGISAIAVGYNTVASGDFAFAEGSGTVADGDYSHAENDRTTALGDGAHAEGVRSNANGNYSHAGGVQADANHHAEWARSSCGDAGYGYVSYAGLTTNNTPQELFVDGTFSATGSQRFSVAPDETYRVTFKVMLVEESSGDAKEFRDSTGLIKNVGGTTSFVAAMSFFAGIGDAGLANATIAVTADNTNDAVAVTVTGITGRDIRWFVSMEYVKIVRA